MLMSRSSLRLMRGLKNYSIKNVNQKIETNKNEILVSSKGQIKKYLAYALKIFTM